MTPDSVYKLWMTPVKDLPLCAWWYFSRLLERWCPCHGAAEAAWRSSRGDKVALEDERDVWMDRTEVFVDALIKAMQ